MSRRRVVITGGATGIGRACALEMARAGDHVFILNRDAQKAAVGRDRNPKQRRAMADGLQADVTDRMSLERTFDSTRPLRRSDQLRRHDVAGTVRTGDGSGVSKAARREPARLVRLLSACRPRHAVGRTHRECLLARSARRKRHFSLRSNQGRGERPHPIAGDRTPAARHHRECGRARLHRYAAVALGADRQASSMLSSRCSR